MNLQRWTNLNQHTLNSSVLVAGEDEEEHLQHLLGLLQLWHPPEHHEQEHDDKAEEAGEDEGGKEKDLAHARLGEPFLSQIDKGVAEIS